MSPRDGVQEFSFGGARRGLGVVACLTLAATVACTRPRGGSAPKSVAPEIVEIVRLEGAREGGERLVALARAGALPVRVRAIVALGRQGDEANVPLLVSWLSDSNAAPEIRASAAEALGLIGSPAAAPGLVAALSTPPQPWHDTVAAALGRCGDASAAPALTTLLAAPTPTLRAAAARALGALGQRKQPLPDASLAALVPLAKDADAAVRYAVAYALFRVPAETLAEAALAALVGLASDPDAETRAVAVHGLVAHHGPTATLVAALADADWRVSVQAVRGLGAEKSTPAEHTALVTWLAKELERADWTSPRAHAWLEALSKLMGFVGEPDVDAFLRGAPAFVADATSLAQDTACSLVFEAGARGKISPLQLCREASLYPWHERVRLAMDGVRAKRWMSDAEALRTIVRFWTRGITDGKPEPDARVRAAIAEAAVAFLPDAQAEGIVLEAFADADPIVVGSAADALSARLGDQDPSAARALLDAAAARLAKVSTPRLDPELEVGLVGVLCAVPSDAYRAALLVAHASPSAVVRTAARECLTKITGADPGPGTSSAAEPATPADPTRLLGHRVSWTVTTTQGDFTLALDADVAPWNVATMTLLAEKGFYDGTLWHRVVPDFVVQGGDPTGSGWGGPGYAVPAEASARRYTRGSIGIADAGKDTGGSQWFIMHSAAPHLEQRYTRVGEVTNGMDVVDRLHVGDRIVRIRVTIDP